MKSRGLFLQRSSREMCNSDAISGGAREKGKIVKVLIRLKMWLILLTKQVCELISQWK